MAEFDNNSVTPTENQPQPEQSFDVNDDASVDRYFMNRASQETQKPVENQAQEQQQAVTPQQMYKIKHNGKEVEMSHDDLIANAQKGFDYEFKSKQLAPMKELGGLLKSSGITQDDIALLAKAKSGDPTAYSVLAKRMGVNLYDLDEVGDDVVSKYSSQGSQNQTAQVNPQVSEMMNTLEQTSPESYQKLMSVQETLPSKIWDTFVSDPRFFANLNKDVETGLFDKVYSRMQRDMLGMSAIEQQMVSSDMPSFVNKYLETFNAMEQEFQSAEDKKKSPQAQMKAGVQGDGMVRQPPRQLTQRDMMNMSDDDLDKLYLANKRK